MKSSGLLLMHQSCNASLLPAAGIPALPPIPHTPERPFLMRAGSPENALAQVSPPAAESCTTNMLLAPEPLDRKLLPNMMSSLAQLTIRSRPPVAGLTAMALMLSCRSPDPDPWPRSAPPSSHSTCSHRRKCMTGAVGHNSLGFLKHLMPLAAIGGSDG